MDPTEPNRKYRNIPQFRHFQFGRPLAFLFAANCDIFGGPTIIAMELDRLSASILALAEFHGICMAYDLCSENNSTLEEKFPVFKNENLMWIQPDMLHFLRNVSQNAQKFLYNLKPQEKALHQRFSKVRYYISSTRYTF